MMRAMWNINDRHASGAHGAVCHRHAGMQIAYRLRSFRVHIHHKPFGRVREPYRPPCGCGLWGGQALCFCKPHACITPYGSCSAPKCRICLHRGATEPHQTVTDRPKCLFSVDFLKKTKQFACLALHTPWRPRHVWRGAAMLDAGAYIWPLAGPHIAKKGGAAPTTARGDRQTHFGTFDFWFKPGVC